MKKTVIPFLILSVLVSCTKSSYVRDDYSRGPITGSGSVENTSKYEKYIGSIALQFVADNLLAAEDAILYDKLERYETDEEANFHPDGQSVWTEGSVWTIDKERSIKGVSMEKTAQDSTWILSRDADYTLPSGTYPTKYSLLVTCHKSFFSARGGSHFNWDVSFVEFERTELSGLSARCSTTNPIFYDAGTNSDTRSWVGCSGKLTMDVFRDGSRIDRMLILYAGGTSHQFIRDI